MTPLPGVTEALIAQLREAGVGDNDVMGIVGEPLADNGLLFVVTLRDGRHINIAISGEALQAAWRRAKLTH